MSWTSIRPYFQQRLSAVGLNEWPDGFNFQNIPSDIIDGTYHLEFGDFSGESLNQNDLESLVRVTIRIFKKGFSDVQSAIDDAIQIKEDVVKECVKPSNRLTQPFKNVIYVAGLVRALDESNDNTVTVEIQFDVRAVLDVVN